MTEVLFNMKTRRRQWLLVAALAATLALTACADNNETPQPANGNESAQNNGASNDTASDNGSDTDKAPDTIQGTGQYVGQIDTHSIEINGPEGPAAYQLAEGMEIVLETLQEGDNIAFEYYERAVEGDDTVKQLVLTSISKSASDGGGTSGAEGSKLDGLAASKTIDVEVEGMVEPREAKLVKGEGYGFYMFEQFSFDAAANKLTMNIDPDYAVEFVKLPSDYNLDTLREEGEQELKSVGEIRELKDEELHKSMQGASLFLIASGDGLTKEYIVKEFNGTGYVFKVNMPHREASEGFGPLAFASINSLVSE
jgi:hypothetical protein